MSNRTCQVSDCDARSHARQLCSTHYSRLLKTGTTDPIEVSVVDRFMSKVEKTDTCWLWTAALFKATGYGAFHLHGKATTAHRVAYNLFVGEVASGADIDHRCWVRRCVNPAHLQAVTHQKNGENLSGAAATSGTGVRGVWFDRSRDSFAVNVKVFGKKHWGGRFPTLAEAEAAAIALRNRLMTNNLADRA